jgi:hypothetical protein
VAGTLVPCNPLKLPVSFGYGRILLVLLASLRQIIYFLRKVVVWGNRPGSEEAAVTLKLKE